MRSWAIFAGCVALGLAVLVCGAIVPVHLRAVDTVVLARAGKNTPSLIDHGLALLNSGNPGSAALIANAAQNENFNDVEKLRSALKNPPQAAPAGPAGSVAATLGVFPANEPVIDWAVHLENRDRI